MTMFTWTCPRCEEEFEEDADHWLSDVIDAHNCEVPPPDID